MRKLFILLVVAGAAVGAAGAVHCVCSSPGECEPLTEEDCPQGSSLVWDPCGCCRVCARLEFEPCGGPDGFLGTCARGLQCVAENADLNGICKKPPAKKSGDCGLRARERTGCNIAEGKCTCGASIVCPGDLPPFTFENRAECEINLKSSSVSEGVGGWTADGCQTQNGEPVAHGAHWWSEDRCMDCHCKHGQLDCSATHCSSCLNPHYVPGACCPTCNDSDIHLPHCKLLEGCPLKCKHGLKKDQRGCFSCECHKIDGEDCPLLCPESGFLLDSSGSQLCECANQTLSSTLAPIHTNLGPRPCPDGHLLRLDGEQWYDGCRECVCRNGTHLCSLLGCPRCPGASYTLPGECCPRCNGSASEGPAACQSADGAVYPVGERWKLDDCAWCECGEGGQVLCGQEPCPPAACEAPLPLVDGCCPRCATVAHRPPPAAADACPAHRTEGESWRDGACTSCLCVKGVVVCYEQKCPPPACPLPVSISGRCCPLCTNVSNSCVLDNNTYMPGDSWTRPGCEECVCKEGGQVVCSQSPVCAPLNCQNSIKVPEKCCPTCPSELEATSNYTVVWIVLGTLCVLGVVVSVVACFVWRGGKWAYLQSWCCNSKVQSLKSPSPTLFYSPVKHLEPVDHNGTPGEYMQVNTEHDSSHV